MAPDISKDTIKSYQNKLQKIKQEVAKVVVGQEAVLNGILRGILANGHVLLEGVPGVAKTLLIRCLAQASGCKFSRIQFTVDLLPTDITGITAYDKVKGFYTVKGPIFANFVIADEVNRAPPKTQSALLEAMQEKQVTIAKQTFKLDLPFFVMANNNPLESAGVYPLPEAQVDRFLFKLFMDYPKKEEEKQVIEQNISLNKFEDFGLKSVIKQSDILAMQEATKQIGHSDKIKDYIIELVYATRKPSDYGLKLGKYVELGGSPRAAINLFIAAKADALLSGSNYVLPQNVKNIAHDVLRHRIILNYRGEAEKVTTDDIIEEILSKIPVP